jgi:hypothetical protein
MFFVRGVFGGLVAWAVTIFTLGIILFMPLWDGKNRNIWDRTSGCVVIRER